jgi:hypothetical protein
MRGWGLRHDYGYMTMDYCRVIVIDHTDDGVICDRTRSAHAGGGASGNDSKGTNPETTRRAGRSLERVH